MVETSWTWFWIIAAKYVLLQMEDGYKLFDYDVGLNDIIQLLERKITKVESHITKVEVTKESNFHAVFLFISALIFF